MSVTPRGAFGNGAGFATFDVGGRRPGGHFPAFPIVLASQEDG
jgi:hypothetical protein